MFQFLVRLLAAIALLGGCAKSQRETIHHDLGPLVTVEDSLPWPYNLRTKKDLSEPYGPVAKISSLTWEFNRAGDETLALTVIFSAEGEWPRDWTIGIIDRYDTPQAGYPWQGKVVEQWNLPSGGAFTFKGLQAGRYYELSLAGNYDWNPQTLAEYTHKSMKIDLRSLAR